MNELKPQTKPSSDIAALKTEYVPPTEAQIEKYATGVCKKLEEQTYQRLRAILETQYYQKQQEEWSKIQTRFHNPLNP